MLGKGALVRHFGLDGVALGGARAAYGSGANASGSQVCHVM